MHAGCTVIVNVHVPVFAEASVAVHVTVVTPTGNAEPDAGTQLTVAPGQLSEAVGVVYVTVADPEDGGASTTVMFAGHVTVGASLSVIVTVNVHVAVFAAASVAVHVTVVMPTGNVEPDAGTHATVTPGQLSEPVGVVYVTTAEHWPAVLGCVILAGQVMAEGASVS